MTLYKNTIKSPSDYKRIAAFDNLKGIAIFLVVMCHCMQYITGTSFDNLFYSTVYSFHMPLFAIISGYLLAMKMDKPLTDTLTKQFKRLIVPNLAWGTLTLCINCFLTNTPPHLSNIIQIPNFCWFLSSLFVCSICYIIAYKILVKTFFVSCICLSMISLLLPGCEFIKFLMPFVGIGIILANVNIDYSHIKWVYIAMAIITIVIAYLLFWSRDFYIYKTTSPSLSENMWHKWIAYFARIGFGSAISIILIFMFRKLETHKSILPKTEWRYLRILSKNSLGIYVIHFSFFTLTTRIIQPFHMYSSIVTILFSAITSIIIITLINSFISILRKNDITRILMLGETPNK